MTDSGRQGHDKFLRYLAGKLSEAGLEVRECTHGDELIEISVTSPDHPGEGRAMVGYDGFLTWEQWFGLKSTPEANEVASVMATLFTQGLTGKRKPSSGRP